MKLAKSHKTQPALAHPMNQEIVKQIVDEILSSLEPLETQSTALLQFLKAKGLATDEELAPFLDQAANTANVRWRAVRVRAAALLTNAMKPTEPAASGNKKEAQPADQDPEEPSEPASLKTKTEPAPPPDTSNNSQPKISDPAAKKDAADQTGGPTKSPTPAKEKTA
jgi:hypothetical protein